MFDVQPYVTSDIIARNSSTWGWPIPNPFTFNQDGTLTIQVKSYNAHSVSPDYDQLASILDQYKTAPLNVSISHWSTLGSQPRILIDHAALLFRNIHRWRHLRIDAHLFNYLVCLEECQGFQYTSAELESITIDQLNEAAMGDISPLSHFLNQLACSVPNRLLQHLDLDSNTSFYEMKLSRKQIYNLPFNHLRSLTITAPIPGAQVYQILDAGGHTIEKLVVSHLTGPCPKPDALPIDAKRLLELKLVNSEKEFSLYPNGDLGWVFGLLRKIKARGLRSLTLGYENEWDSQAYAEFYANSGGVMPLRTLRLEKMRMDASQFKKCMDLNDPLTELVVDSQMDVYKNSPSPLIFTRKICDWFTIDHNYTKYLERLVVRDQCIEQSGCFGQMLKKLPSACGGMLRELIILGDDRRGEITLHPADQHVLDILEERGLSVEYQYN